MASIFQKARIATLSVVHGLLDAAIDLNSIGAVRQHVRDLEKAMEDLENSAAEATGRVTTIRNEANRLASEAQKLNNNIDTILGDDNPDNDYLAKSLEAKLVGTEERQEASQDELASASETAQTLNEAAEALKTKHESMLHQLRQLEASDKASDAKERAAQAIRHAGSVASSGADASVDSVTARMETRANVADEKFRRAMGSFASGTEKDLALAEVEARLAKRRAKLAENK